MLEIFVLPITIVSLCLYLFQSFSGIHSRFGVALCLFAGLALSFVLLKKYSAININFKSILLILKKYFLPIFFIFSISVIVSLIISPFVFGQSVDGYNFLRFPGVFDYYKHAYTLTAINQFGVPPQHPYFPPMKFSYYYGYYLIPAAIAKAFNLDQNTVFFVYVFITNIISLTLIYWLICKLIKPNVYRIIAMFSIFFGTAYDIFPALNLKSGFIHIDNWFGIKETGLIVYNFYTGFLWQPQHVLPAVLALLLVYKVYKENISSWIVVLVSFYIVLSSVFVALTMAFWLGIVFLVKKDSRKSLIVSGLFSGMLLFPFLQSLSNRAGLIQPYALQAFPFTTYLTVNTFLTLVVEYGLSLFGLIFVVFFTKRWELKLRLAIVAGIFLPIVFTWFFRSSGPNDFSMKFIFPIEIAYNLIFIAALTTFKSNRLKMMTIILLCFSILSGMGGAVFEYYHRWKTRFIFSYQDSSLQLAVRKLDNNIRLASIDREEWVFNLPVLGYHSVLSPSLFDAGVYIGSLKPLSNNYSFSGRNDEIFIAPTNGFTIDEMIDTRNNLFKEVNKFFSSVYDFDYLILPKSIWVKDGQSFWFAFMNYLDVKNIQLTDQFSLFDHSSIIEKTNNTFAHIDRNKVQVFYKKDKTFIIPSGFWFVSACVDPNEEYVNVEFDEFYTLFNTEEKDYVKCSGQVFYIGSEKIITISSSTNTERIYIFPIIFSPLL